MRLTIEVEDYYTDKANIDLVYWVVFRCACVWDRRVPALHQSHQNERARRMK